MSAHVRDTKLDIARGLAITAIVVGHVGRGLVDAGTLGAVVYAPWDRVLYMSHLAVFVLVSGVLTPAGVRRHGARQYAVTRVRLFLYLYVLWSLLQGAVRVVMSNATNNQMTWLDVLQLWTPRGQMWFLPFMAAATVLVVVTQPWNPERRWIAGVALAVSLIVWGKEGGWVFTQGWPLVGALFVGTLLGEKGTSWFNMSRRPLAVGLVVVSAFAGYVTLLSTSASPPTYRSSEWSFIEAGYGMVAATTGVVFVLALSAILATTRAGAVIAILGRNSLVIFLAHILAASGARVLLTAAGVEDVWVHLLLGAGAGVVLPLLLVAVTRNPAFRWVVDDKPLVGKLSDPAVRASGEGQ